MKKSFSTVLSTLAALLAIGASAAALADGHEAAEAKPAALSEVWVMVPKPGHEAELEAGMKKHVAARKEAGDPREWHAYVTAIGDEFGPYSVRHCCFDWPDQDAYVQWVAESGIMAHFTEHVAPHVAKYEHYIDVFDWKNSHWPLDGGDWSYVGVTEWTPKMGHEMERAAALSKMTSTAKENGWEGRWIFYSSIGGATSLKLAVPFTNYADMAPPEKTFFQFMVEHLGEEEATATFKAFSDSFWGSSYNVYQLRTDLSTPADEG